MFHVEHRHPRSFRGREVEVKCFTWNARAQRIPAGLIAVSRDSFGLNFAVPRETHLAIQAVSLLVSALLTGGFFWHE